MIEGMNALYIGYKINLLVNMYLYLKCIIKWGIQNTKYKIINQHRNDSCHL